MRFGGPARTRPSVPELTAFAHRRIAATAHRVSLHMSPKGYFWGYISVTGAEQRAKEQPGAPVWIPP